MRRALIALIALSVVWALAVALVGGIDLRPYGIPFKSTDPDRAAALGLVLVLVYALAYRDYTRTHATALEVRAKDAVAVLGRRAVWIAALMAAVVLALGYVYGAHAAGGADSYGYISQADLWLKRDLVVEQPIASKAPWPEAEWSFAPLGYRPSPDRTGIVPTYSYGLPVLMAAGKLIAGMCGLFLVTPFLGALMVGLTYALGAQLWSRTAGVAAAALMATSPTFLFMQMNPMSDVPASALFTGALVLSLSRVRGRAFWTGVVASLAIFVRPNLVPLGAIFLVWLVLCESGWRGRVRAALSYGVGGFPLVAAVAITNALVHGAPWSSGYGALDQYYSWTYIGTNLQRYGLWLLESETPFVLLSAVPLLLLRRVDDEHRQRLLYVALFAAGVGACYAFYAPFDAWWYLRFYLPAYPAMLVLAVIGLRQLLSTLPGSRRVLAMAVVVMIVLAVRIHRTQEENVFRLWETGASYTSVADYIRRELPRNAVILTVQHSGSIRYYSDRLTVRWDFIGADWWPRTLEVLAAMGYRPYLLVSPFEEAQLRKRFGLGDQPDAPGTVMAVSPQPFADVLYDPLRGYSGTPQVMPQVVSCPCQIP